MGKDFHDAFQSSRRVYGQASEILGWNVAERCFQGPQAELNRTAVSQPAIFVTSMAVIAAIEETGVRLACEATAAAGLSLGEYSALAFAGALRFSEALPVVRKRGEFMEAACNAAPGAMVSIIGMENEAVAEICREAAQGQALAPANFNSPGQVVASGHKEAVERVAALAEERGARRALPLQVAGAFHSALMTPAAEQLRSVLEHTRIVRPNRVVVPNVTAEPTEDPEALRSALVKQVDHSVLWCQSIQQLIADGYDRFVEVAPGKVLSGLLRRIDPSVGAINISRVDQLRKLMAETS